MQVLDKPAPDVAPPESLRAAALRALPRASVMVFDRDLRLVLAEGRALLQHGYAPETLVGARFEDILPPAAADVLLPRYRAALAGEHASLEYRTADGTRWYEVDIAPMRDATGAVIGGLAISQDISDRRAAEQQVEAHREWLQDILDSLDIPIAVKDADARFALVNTAYAMGIGVEPAAMIGRTVFDVFPPEFAQLYADDDARVIADGDTVAEERPVPWADGTLHTLLMTRSALRRPDGEVYGLVNAGLDISARKRTEEELRALTRQFETAFAKAPIGMAMVGLDGRFLRVNDKLCEITGYPAGELVQLSFQDITHADDLGADLDQADQLLAGEIDSYTMEKRYYTKAGHLIWVLLAGSLVRDDDGRPLHFIAQVQDISERKRMVERLEELADRDPITDLLNRRRFEDELRQQVDRCRRYGEQATLLILDVDRFKQVNDTHGHVLGDAALRGIARALRERMRSSDIVARIGGDEFAVLLLNVAPEQARVLADEVREAIHAAPVVLGGHRVNVTVSIGLKALDARTVSDQAAFAEADRAMYVAKEQGRDRVAMAS